MRKMLKKTLALVLCVALGLGLFGGAFAADEQTGTFDLETVCTDDGQFVSKVIVHLEEAITEEDMTKVAEAFEVSVNGYDRNFYGWPVAGDFARTVAEAKVSEDGKTVTLNLAITGAFPDSLSYKSDYTMYTEEGYKVTMNGTALTFSGKMTDPLEDKWGAVDLTETEYNYRFFTPDGETYAKPEAGYPLIVWLHGAGESGTENKLQITANRVTAWGEPETQDLFGGAYVIAPQMDGAKNPTGWGWNPEVVMATIEAFIKSVGETNIDRNRIVIGGCSMGGMGTWATIKMYPDYFAAAFPICGMTTFSGEDLVALKGLPIYLIHTVEDGTVNITGSLSAYDTLTAAGKTNIYLALYEHTWTVGTPDSTPEEIAMLAMNGHSSWIYAHNDIDGEKEADKYFLETFNYTTGEGDAAVTTTYTNTKPSELGYTSFKAWLAGQAKAETYYTVGREVVAFGEVVTSVTVHGLERIRATIKTADWLKDNPVKVVAKNVTVTDMAAGTSEIKDIEREPISIEIGEDRTSLIIKFEAGQAFVQPETSPNVELEVTVGEQTIPYGNTTSDTDAWESITYTTPEYNWRGTNMTTMSARAFTPDKETYAKPENGYPLVVWLHGGGEIGTDNRIQITANDVPNWTEKESQDIFGGAYVLAPQNHAAAGEGAPAATLSVIEQFVAAKGDIDRTRIYVGGCSYGGGSTWTMIRNYPYYFAAAFPMCAQVNLTDEEAASLANLPIYTMISTGDGASSVYALIKAYNQLKAAGNENLYIALFEHSEYPGCETLSSVGVYIDHFVWVYAHADFDGKGDDFDGKNFIDTAKDGEYTYANLTNKVVVQDGILTFSYTEGDEELSVKLNGQNSRPEDAGYATFKTWIAAQKNEKPSPFKDVAPTDEAFDNVRTLWENGITNGTSSNTFEPDSTLTRAEFVTFLARVAGAAVDNKAETKFTDLAETWYVGSVAWAVEQGLIIGATDTTFEPYEALTQAQVNIILERNGSEPAFEAPEGTVTRAQAAEILVNLMAE